jgi:hypothetical protein
VRPRRRASVAVLHGDQVLLVGRRPERGGTRPAAAAAAATSALSGGRRALLGELGAAAATHRDGAGARGARPGAHPRPATLPDQQDALEAARVG